MGLGKSWGANARGLGSGLLVVGSVLAVADPGLAATAHQGHGATPLPGLGLIAAFLLGLLSSTHCLGMCGPLVGLYSSQLGLWSVRSAYRQHLLFNLGRMLAYTNLGILVGAASSVLRVRPWTAGFIGVAAGLFVLAMGTRFLGAGGVGVWLDRVLAPPTGVLVAIWRRYVALARSPGILLLGALHGLLPCPSLYVMLTSVVALADPILGGLLLLSFSLGTVPMMWGMGALGHYLSPSHRLMWQRTFGWAVTAWGLILVIRGLQGLGLL